MLKHLVIACLLGASLSGCVQSKQTGASLDHLSAAYSADAQALADVTADELAERHSPATTTLALSKTSGTFGESFEKALRLKGFSIVAPNYGGNSLGVSYKLDALEGAGTPVGYAQVATSDGKIFSVSRTLGEIAYTEPPQEKVQETLEERPLSSPVQPVLAPSAPAPTVVPAVASVPEPAPTVRTYPVKKTGTAAAIARRSGVPVDDFCRWNGVGKLATLPKGTMVYLSEPPEGTILQGAPVPVPPGAEATLNAEHAASAAPIPSSVPSVVQTSYKPSLASDASPIPTDVAPVAPIQTWDIQKGQALRKQIEGWSAVAGYHLIWDSHNDYMMESSASFNGSFTDAVKSFFGALQANGHALRVTIHEGNKTMVISEH